MVTVTKEHSSKQHVEQDFREASHNPNKLGPSTPSDFTAKNPTPYGGLLPVATMLERPALQSAAEGTVTLSRRTKVISMYQVLPSMVLGTYVGFARVYELRFNARDPILVRILKIQE